MRLKKTSVASLLVLATFFGSVAMATYSDFSDGRIANRQPTPVFGLPGTLDHAADISTQDDAVGISVEDGEVRILRTTQKVNLNQFVPTLIKINNLDIAAVRELRPIARQICAMEGGYAQIVRDKKTGDRYVYVVCPPFQVPYVEAAIKALDKEWMNATDDGSGLTLYKAHFRDISDVDRVATAYAGGSSAIHTLDNAVTHLNYPGNIGSYESVAMLADIPVNEISIDAKFYETDTQNDLKLGLDYVAWKNNAGANLFNVGAGSARINLDDDTINNVLFQGYNLSNNYRFRSFNFAATAAYYDFLASKGKAKLMTEAALTVVSGNSAHWEDAQPITGLYVSGTNASNGNVAGVTNVSVQDLSNPGTYNAAAIAAQASARTDFAPGDSPLDMNFDREVRYGQTEAVGVFLDVLPVVGIESTELEITALVKDINGMTPAGIPTVTYSSIDTIVRVRDGEELAIGGLTRSEKVKQKNGVPWLSDLPVLGYLFGGETKMDRKKNVVITLDTTTCVGLVDPQDHTVALTYDEWTKLAAEGDYSKLDCRGIPPSADDAVTMMEAMGEQKPVIPATTFGFDQWLLDPAK